MKWLGWSGLLALMVSGCVAESGGFDYGFTNAGDVFEAGKNIERDALVGLAGVYASADGQQMVVLMPRRGFRAVQAESYSTLDVLRWNGNGFTDPSLGPFLAVEGDAGPENIKLTFGDASAPVTWDLQAISHQEITSGTHPVAPRELQGDVKVATMLTSIELAKAAGNLIYDVDDGIDMEVNIVTGFNAAGLQALAVKMNMLAIEEQMPANLKRHQVQAIRGTVTPDETNGKFLVVNTLHLSGSNDLNAVRSLLEPTSGPATTPGPTTNPNPTPTQPPTTTTPRRRTSGGCSAGGHAGGLWMLALGGLALFRRRRSGPSLA